MMLQTMKGKENCTREGRTNDIYANIGSVSDVVYVLENDAGGIGLFRSEFLYLGRNDFSVVIRTLDIGGTSRLIILILAERIILQWDTVPSVYA